MVTDRRYRRALWCASVLYLLGVARMTLWPDFASPDQLDALRSLTAWLTGHGVPVTYDGLEAGANVAMFVPFGVLGGLLVGGRHRWGVVAAGCAVSAAIETSQLLFLPARVPTVQDVVLNTAGAAVGLVALAVVVAARRPTPGAARRQAATGGPGEASGTDTASGMDPAAGTDPASGPDPAAGTDPASGPDPAAGTDPASGPDTTRVQ